MSSRGRSKGTAAAERAAATSGGWVSGSGESLGEAESHREVGGGLDSSQDLQKDGL